MLQIKSCILCNASKFKFLYNSFDRMLGFPGEFFVKKCENCSLVFLDPQPRGVDLKKYYPSKDYYAYNKAKKRGFIQILREYLIKHYYSPNLLSLLISTFIHNVPAMPADINRGKVLDIGCGAGDTLLLLKDLGFTVYGIDMDKRAIETAKTRGIQNLKFGTYEALLQYPDNYFDVIRMYHVIEHIDNPVRCFEIIHKKLKKDGELVVGTPNVDSVISRLFNSYWYNLDSPRHLFLFSPKTLRQMAKKTGFITEKIEFCQASGIAGSLEYLIAGKLGKKINLVHNLAAVLFFYPLDWLFNRLGLGDVFVLRARKKNN